VKTRRGVPQAVSTILDGRPVRWAPRDATRGDYDGRERTLEVFFAEAGDQRSLSRRLFDHRQDIARSAGGSPVIIFHTPEESRRLYWSWLTAQKLTESFALPGRARTDFGDLIAIILAEWPDAILRRSNSALLRGGDDLTEPKDTTEFWAFADATADRNLESAPRAIRVVLERDRISGHVVPGSPGAAMAERAMSWLWRVRLEKTLAIRFAPDREAA